MVPLEIEFDDPNFKIFSCETSHLWLFASAANLTAEMKAAVNHAISMKRLSATF